MNDFHEKNVYRTLLDNISDGVYFVDREHRITYWNEGSKRLTGYGAEEVIGRGCSDNILRHIDDNGNELCEAGCPLQTTINDTAGRWGGEEFVAVISNVDVNGLKKMAERYRTLVEHSYVRVGKERIQVTISVGATGATGDDRLETLLKKADLALYRAKEKGRNRVDVSA